MDRGGLGPGYDLLGFLGTVTDAVPDSTPLLVNEITKRQLKPFRTPKIRTFGETFDFTTPRSQAAGSALGVPLARTVDALEVINRVHKASGQPVENTLHDIRWPAIDL